jgi:hypothetical protein
MSGLGPRKGPTPRKPYTLKDGPRRRKDPQFEVGRIIEDSRGQRYMATKDGSVRRVK